MQRTYQELYPGQSLSHLAQTVDQYLSKETPLWWVNLELMPEGKTSGEIVSSPVNLPVACLWLGNAIDQVSGDRHAHIFLLYVNPEHRRRGIGSALMHRAETWARNRGDGQIGLQVFQSNHPALRLYEKLGYHPQSLWLVKRLGKEEG
jgi:ribosomal protein S18 acetylase RimI-like enzyme